MPADAGQAPAAVIVGVDGSERDADAVALARLLAGLSDARVIAVSTYTDQPLRDPDAPGVDEIRLARATSPARGLQGVAEATDARFIVVGSTHRAGLGRVLPGAVGDRLLQGSPCAVAIAPRGFAAREDVRPRVVAAGFELTEESRAAVDLAAMLAGAAEATIRILTVVTPQTVRDLRMEALALRNSLPSQLRADARVLEGRAAAELIDQAEQGVDVLVLGSRGYGSVGRALLGSVASEVVHAAPCPVVIVPRRTVISAHAGVVDTAAPIVPADRLV